MIPGSANPLLLKSAAAAGGYQIERSLRFNSSDSAYLSRAVSSSGNRRTWTYSVWVNRAALQSGTTNTYMQIFSAGTSGPARDAFFFDTDVDDTLAFYSANGLAGPATLMFRTNAVFRDASAGYHIVLSVDTTQATAANRVKLYVNNTEQTFSTVNYPSQNAEGYINLNNAHYIATHPPLTEYLSALLADIHFIDGQALTPSAFAETNAATGQWVPKAYTGSFGTNGFWLKFSDNSNNTAATLGKDYSGNSNNWTPNNLSVTAGAGNDSLVDTPTSYGTDTGAGGEVRGNYATINPLSKAANATLSNGNLDVTNTVSGSAGCASTIGMSSGKWYCEVTVNAVGSETKIGICKENAIQSEAGSVANSWAYGNNGEKFNSNVNTSYGNSFTTGDVIGIAFDADAGSLYFYKNGTVQNSGTAAYTSLTSGPYFFQFTARNVTSANNLSTNFGQRPFAYTAPSGFKALVDTNLTAPLVAKPNTVMDVKLYTGNGSTQTISGLGFSPDLVWIKTRSAAANNRLLDAIRGATKELYSNLTNAEGTDANGLTAFNSDGFSLGNSSGYNDNAVTHVAWCWDAGTSTVTNTQGSITSQVRANASAGFSIVTYTGNGTSGATVGHSLNVTPSLVITKNRASVTAGWYVYHKNLSGAGYVIYLNSTSAQVSDSTPWNSTAPTSTVFSVGTNSGTNGNGNNMVAYCFAPVAGYSSFGSYTGNGSTDGPFVYTGFRPKFILAKASSIVEYWEMYDTSRDTYNAANKEIFANTSGAEVTGGDIDILSNGFKIRNAGSGFNSNAQTYIYAAFAESPFQYARAR